MGGEGRESVDERKFCRLISLPSPTSVSGVTFLSYALDRSIEPLLEILKALGSTTPVVWTTLANQAPTLDLSEAAEAILAARGIVTRSEARRKVAAAIAPTLEAIRARPE
jgi:hypothetical protein